MSYITCNLTDLETNIDDIESVLSTVDSNVSSLQSDVSNLSTAVSSVETKVDTIDSIVDTVGTNVAKIDNETVLGLSGTADSLAYKVHEIEKHFHSVERWYGRNPTTGFLLAEGIESFVLTAGTASAWGSEVQISQGTEIEGGDPVKKIDFHRILISISSVQDKTYLIEFRYGTATFASSSILTQVSYRMGNLITEVMPLNMTCIRIPCNQKIWARCKSQGNGASIEFILGLHIYIA